MCIPDLPEFLSCDKIFGASLATIIAGIISVVGISLSLGQAALTSDVNSAFNGMLIAPLIVSGIAILAANLGSCINTKMPVLMLIAFILCLISLVFAFYGVNAGFFIAGFPYLTHFVAGAGNNTGSSASFETYSRDCTQNFLHPICWYALIIVIGYVGLFFTLINLMSAVWKKRKEVDLLSKFDGSVAI